MKNKKKGIIILITLGIIFAISTISNQNLIDDQSDNKGSINFQDETNLKSPKKSGFWTPSFIHIDNNWSLAASNLDWVQGGDGSWEDPYIIENVSIDASSSPTGSGIFIINSKNDFFVIRNATVYNAGSGTYDAGIKIENTNNGILTNNNCSDNGENGIILYNNCDNNTISGNTANNNANYGIYLYENCDDNTISGNAANNNAYYGIFLNSSCINNTISGNTASNDGTNNQASGIFLRNDCDNNIISGNTANNNRFNGIHLNTDCVDNIISGNIAINDDGNNNQYIGIYLYNNCTKNIISGNTANDNQFIGIYLYTDCDNNTISGNSASNNITSIQNDGIILETNCDNNTISWNLIKNNIQYGIDIETTCENNLIYQNSLKGNGAWHARDDGTNNQWNNSIIGNYWDNHTSPDSDINGIVDTSYTWITGTAGSVDHFPLAESPIHVGNKIHIDDSSVSALNWSRTATLNTWCSGSGTFLDPYIIDGLEINAGGTESGILIGNSSVYFTIQYCKVYNSGTGTTDAGIKLSNTNNGTITNNNCSNNGNGILLYTDCDQNTISDNIANNNSIRYGIVLYGFCNENAISGNTANDNPYYGIYLYWYCDSNNVSGNTANNNTKSGIHLEDHCDSNNVTGNTANNNTEYGISLNYDCNNNKISGNIEYDNNQDGIYINLIDNCDYNTISENYIYFNTDWPINISSADCDENIIKTNVLVSLSSKFINDGGTNTILGYNYFGTSLPSFFVEFIAQSFSPTEFIVTINISSYCIGLEVTSLSIQMWWNDTTVLSNNITELGQGLFNISLTPILVSPGEKPIILNMTISDLYHSNRYYELKLIVDPEAVDKGPGPGSSLPGGSAGDGGDDDDDVAVVVIWGYNLFILVGGITAISLLIYRKRIDKVK